MRGSPRIKTGSPLGPGRDDLVVLSLLIGFTAAAMGIAYISPFRAPGGPVTWLNPITILVAVSEHALGGFLVGAAALKPRRAIVGLLFQPLIDIDHVSVFVNLPINPRIGHDVFVPALLVISIWALRLKEWRVADSSLFVSAQYAVHLAMAPPGFPLLGPFVPSNLYFPDLWPGAVGFVLVLLTLVLALNSRRQADLVRSRDPDPSRPRVHCSIPQRRFGRCLWPRLLTR